MRIPDVAAARWAHPRLLGLAGLAASTALVVGAARAGWPTGVAAPPGPFGLWRAVSEGRGWFAALATVAVGALAVLFVACYRRAARGELGVAAVARTAALWGVPVLLGPPLLSLDAYSYIAQGRMLLAGFDPYLTGPAALGAGPVLDAVAPVWRDTPAPYGPLALAGLRLAAQVGGNNLPGTVYLLRLVAVLAVVATAAVTVRLTEPARRPAALALVAANPLVLLHCVGGVHLDALLAVLAAGTVLAVRRRWWLTAALAATTAFAVKLPGLVLVGYVLLGQARADGLWRPRGWRDAAAVGRYAGTAGVVAATAGACALLVPNGWGWLGALDVPGRVRHHYDPATLLGWLVHLTTRVVGPPVAFPAAVETGRGIAMLVGAVAVLVLVWRATTPGSAGPNLPVPGAALAGGAPGSPMLAGGVPALAGGALLGGALLVLALAAPTVHAWYATWGLALVAAMASSRGRWWLVGFSVALCFTALPDPLTRHWWGHLLRLGLLAVVVVGTVLAARRPPSAVAGAIGAAGYSGTRR
ncbi:polyprenol phosphomannose-dependent alpha 1,6 mannosyltransferase MptB [Plantactinospora sp. CA-290183]|uniref:polyprenol phosphomannose-dependent alpha 1,6 mannosyltransferase MptB n=1 Tax=Plantactinospora sp. CA-290183 TaxID=3240006 RepID=UPI003D89B8AE